MEFYIRKKKEVHGPFTDKQIHAGIKSGKLESNFLISNSKSGPWKTIAEARRGDAVTPPEVLPDGGPPAVSDVNVGSKPPPLPPPISSTPATHATPVQPKTLRNSYWNRQNPASQTAGLSANNPQDKSGKSNNYDLNRMKKVGAERDNTTDEAKKGLVIAGSAISALVVLIMVLVFVFLILPMFAHQSEFRQAKELFQEAVRTVGYYEQEKEKLTPIAALLRRYEERILELNSDLDKIMDNWSESERNRFMAWIKSEGIDYRRRKYIR